MATHYYTHFSRMFPFGPSSWDKLVSQVLLGEPVAEHLREILEPRWAELKTDFPVKLDMMTATLEESDVRVIDMYLHAKEMVKVGTTMHAVLGIVVEELLIRGLEIFCTLCEDKMMAEKAKGESSEWDVALSSMRGAAGPSKQVEEDDDETDDESEEESDCDTDDQFEEESDGESDV